MINLDDAVAILQMKPDIDDCDRFEIQDLATKLLFFCRFTEVAPVDRIVIRRVMSQIWSDKIEREALAEDLRVMWRAVYGRAEEINREGSNVVSLR